MQIKSKIQGNTMYVMLSGELDEYTANYVRTSIDKLIDNGKFSKMILDLSEMDFMDSTGVGVLIGRYKKLKSRKISVYLYNPNSTIERIFRMSGIYEIMPKIS